MERVRRWGLWLWPIAAGGVSALGQAPWGIWFASFLGFAVALQCGLTRSSTGKAALFGWQFGLGYFLVALSWLVHPFLVDPMRHGWMIPFALFAMCGGLALLWSLAFFLAKKVGLSVFGLAGLWAGAEFVRGYMFTGFPWALPGYVWMDTVWIETGGAQIARLIGPYGLTLVTLLLSALLAKVFATKSLLWGAMLATSLLVFFAAGTGLAHRPLPQPTEHSVRVVQPNAPQHLKWDPAHILEFYQRALSLTPSEDADLVIWPETSVAAFLYAAGPMLQDISAAAAPAKALIGLNRIDGNQIFNSAVVLDDAGQVAQLYDKHHLVPFGEYMPLPGLLERVGLRAFTAKAGYGYSSGAGPVLMDMGALGQALPLICYEAIFPRDLRTETRPDWVVQITNDAWFGTHSGPQQALVQARFRAIETGLPVVRAANTGISAVINARGGIEAQLPLGQSGAVTAKLPGADKATFYSKWKEWPFLLLLILLGVGHVLKVVDASKASGGRKTDIPH